MQQQNRYQAILEKSPSGNEDCVKLLETLISTNPTTAQLLSDTTNLKPMETLDTTSHETDCVQKESKKHDM